MRPFVAIVRKELVSAVRTRHAIAAELYFVVGAVLVLVLAFPAIQVRAETKAGLVWIVLYFVAMMTVARSYTLEQEQGTLLYLMHTAPSDAVYWGKLVAGILWLDVVGLIQYGCMGFAELIPLSVEGAIVLTAGASAIGGATSLLAAIVAAARLRGWVFAAIALPIVLPIFFLGIEALAIIFANGHLADIAVEVGLMLLYVCIVVVVAWWLFPFIWSEV